MSAKASQLEKALGKKEYALYAIEALYLNSQVKGASPMLINLAVAFLEKQRQEREAAIPKGGPLPQYFVQLYAKIMTRKGDYDKVLAFLSQHEASFGMIIEKKKLAFKVHLKKGDTLSAINELLGIVGTNY